MLGIRNAVLNTCRNGLCAYGFSETVDKPWCWSRTTTKRRQWGLGSKEQAQLTCWPRSRKAPGENTSELRAQWYTGFVGEEETGVLQEGKQHPQRLWARSTGCISLVTETTSRTSDWKHSMEAGDPMTLEERNQSCIEDESKTSHTNKERQEIQWGKY